MTYSEFQRQLGKAGLTIGEFADIVKMNRNSVTNYAKKGEVPSHLAITATLMGEMAERKIDFRAALAKIELERKRSRGGGVKGKFGNSKQIRFPI